MDERWLAVGDPGDTWPARGATGRFERHVLVVGDEMPVEIHEKRPVQHRNIGSPESRMDEKQIVKKANDLWMNGVHDNLKSMMFYL